MAPPQRPLSPHLFIYRPQLTSMLSILHRFTGIALMIGFVALIGWLSALSVGGNTLKNVQAFWGTLWGKLFLFGWTFSFMYHLLNGIRHLFWDAGFGFELSTVYASGWGVLALAGLMTIGLWWYGGGF